MYTFTHCCEKEDTIKLTDGETWLSLNSKGSENARDPEITAFLRYVDGKADDAEHDGHVHAGLQRIRVDDGIGVVIIDVMIMGLVSCIATATGTVLCRRYQMAYVATSSRWSLYPGRGGALLHFLKNVPEQTPDFKEYMRFVFLTFLLLN